MIAAIQFALILLNLQLAASGAGHEAYRAPARMAAAHIHEEAQSERRPSSYIDVLAIGGVLSEDDGNRLTARDTRRLASTGGVLRAGTVVNGHHMMGIRMQALVGTSRSVLNEEGAVSNDCRGLVINGFVGPEYRCMTDFGSYFGIAIGAGCSLGIDDVEDDCCDDDGCRGRCDRDEDTDVHRSLGLGALVCVGQEVRLAHHFAMYVEFFGGMHHGWDENDKSMNNGVAGVAFGVGI